MAKLRPIAQLVQDRRGTERDRLRGLLYAFLPMLVLSNRMLRERVELAHGEISMLGQTELLKRAQGLAKSGRYRTLAGLKQQLQREGFCHINMVLDVRSVRQQPQERWSNPS